MKGYHGIGDFASVQALARLVLETTLERERDQFGDGSGWTIQGFGMARKHFGPDGAFRLNVWHSMFRAPGVSTVHDHPWDLESVVLKGLMVNRKYVEASALDGGEPHGCAVIKPGPKPEGGGVIERLPDVLLRAPLPQAYAMGYGYRQRHDEVHESIPEDGTVTINFRERVGDDVARVFWKRPGEWVSAVPRPATSLELETVLPLALEGWR